MKGMICFFLEVIFISKHLAKAQNITRKVKRLMNGEFCDSFQKSTTKGNEH